MRKLVVICLLSSVIGLFVLFVAPVSAQVTINTNIPGVTNLNPATGPCTLVFGFYNFALLIGGILAFAAITYGGIRYTLAAGNPSGQSDAKEWVKGAIFGLLLLVGAYLILNVINPDITKCTLPPLTTVANVPPSSGGNTPLTCGGIVCPAGTQSCQTVFNANSPVGIQICGPIVTPTSTYNCTPTIYPVGNCNGPGCTPSPSLNALIYGSCLPSQFKAIISQSTLTGGQHRCDLNAPSISCHFGGRTCTDGGHAIDFSRSALANAVNPLTIPQAVALLQLASCPQITTIRCEVNGGAPAACNVADHIHVNVSNGSCGCN